MTAKIPEIDIWRSAQLLIDRCGDQAWLVASQKADDAIDQGDPEGETVWKRITKAISELNRQKAMPDVARH